MDLFPNGPRTSVSPLPLTLRRGIVILRRSLAGRPGAGTETRHTPFEPRIAAPIGCHSYGRSFAIVSSQSKFKFL